MKKIAASLSDVFAIAPTCLRKCARFRPVSDAAKSNARRPSAGQRQCRGGLPPPPDGFPERPGDHEIFTIFHIAPLTNDRKSSIIK